MTNNQILALHQALETRIKRDNLKFAPGKLEFNDSLIIQLVGTVDKAEKQKYTPTICIPIIATLAIVLQKAGFQRENAKAVIIEAMQAALNADEKAEQHLQDWMNDIAACEAHVKQITNALPKKTREGATKTNLNILEPQLQAA